MSMNLGIRKFLTIASCALAVSLALCFAILAWTEPGQIPPNGNVSTPINIGNTSQYKTGDLGIKLGSNLAYWFTQIGNSLGFKNDAGDTKMIIGQDGNVGIGTTAPGEKLDVAGNSKAWKFCLANECCSSWEECAGYAGGGDLVAQNPTPGPCDQSSYTIGTGNICCPANTCFASGKCVSGGWPIIDEKNILDESNRNYNAIGQPFPDYTIDPAVNCGADSSFPGAILYCDNGLWVMGVDSAPCFQWDIQCEKGACVSGTTTSGPCVQRQGGICVYKTCAGDNDCASFGSGSKCDSGVCCVAGTCNVGGRCVSYLYEKGIITADCVNGTMVAHPSQSCAVYPCYSGSICNASKICTKCDPGITNGCSTCKADGSGWIDDNAKCPPGQTCHSGNCCVDECAYWGEMKCVDSATVATCAQDANSCLKLTNPKQCSFCAWNQPLPLLCY